MERTEINIDWQRKLDFVFEKYRAKRKITKIQFEFALEKETKMIEPEQKNRFPVKSMHYQLDSYKDS